jgi:hypothetical protein
MRFPVTETGLLLGALFAAAVLPAEPAAAAGSYCPNPNHATPGKVPPDLIGAVAGTFQIDNDAVRNAAFVRCVGPKLMMLRRRQSRLRQGRDEPLAAGSNRLVSRQPGFEDHSDVGDRSRHDLRVVLQRPPRNRGQSSDDRRSAGLYRRQLERNTLASFTACKSFHERSSRWDSRANKLAKGGKSDLRTESSALDTITVLQRTTPLRFVLRCAREK